MMDDVIYRQDVLDINMKYCSDDDGSCSEPHTDLREMLDEIENLPSAQQWIPCSERLPEEGVNVLLCIKDWKSQKTKMVVSSRRDYNYWDGLGREIRGDIAWMPLPEPYIGEQT